MNKPKHQKRPPTDEQTNLLRQQAREHIWECDQDGQQWKVHEHQIDGKYFMAVPNTARGQQR